MEPQKSILGLFDRHFMAERQALYGMTGMLLIGMLIILFTSAYIIGDLMDDVRSLKASVKELQGGAR